MIMIERKTQEVFYAPTARKTFITKRGAANAEARARIKRKYPSIPFDPETGEVFHWRELERADDLYRRYSNLIFKAT